MNCEYCQSPVHIWFQCPKKPDGWKPARLARVPRVEAVIPQPVSKEVAHRPVTDLQKADTISPARLAKRSTATRIENGSRQSSLSTVPDALELGRSRRAKDLPQSVAAGDALPVDTNSSEKGLRTKSPRLGMDEVTGLEAERQVATPMTGKTTAEMLGNTCGGGYSDGSEAQKVERRSPKPEDAGSIPATSANAGSSNGRTSGFDPVNAGSTPAPASKFDKKAWMKAYMKPYLRQYRQDVKSGKRVPKKREC